MKIRSFAIALALTGAPAVLAAQQGTAPAAGQHQHARGQRGERQGRVQALLAHRQELKLTDGQVQRLTAIGQRLQQRNAALQQRMRALFQQSGLPDFRARREQRQQGHPAQRPQLTDQQRQAIRHLREQARPLREQMRQNQRAAVQEAKGVLTQQQQDQIKQYARQHRGQRHGRHEGRRGERGQGRPQRAQQDTTRG
jgi:hypothetical protein